MVHVVPNASEEGHVDVVLFFFDNRYEAFRRALKLDRSCATTLRGSKVGCTLLDVDDDVWTISRCGPSKSLVPTVATSLGALSVMKSNIVLSNQGNSSYLFTRSAQALWSIEVDKSRA